VDGAKFRFDPKGCPWRYPSGTLCLGGFAGYDSLLGGFQIVDQRFLLHKSLLDLALNFTATASSRKYLRPGAQSRDSGDPRPMYAGRYLTGNWRFGGFAGCDGLPGGFQIFDQRFLFNGHEEPLRVWLFESRTLLKARVVPNRSIRRPIINHTISFDLSVGGLGGGGWVRG